MHTMPDQHFVPRRLKVHLRMPGSAPSVTCTTDAIGHDHLFIQGGPRLQDGSNVELTFPSRNGEPVSVDCVVAPHGGQNLLLRYSDLAPAQRERLTTTIWPQWDRVNLLDGLILMSDRLEEHDLTDWLRLTSLLCRMQRYRGESARAATGANGAPRTAANPVH